MHESSTRHQSPGSDLGPDIAEDSDKVAALRHAIDHAIHYLPTQGPLSTFVHHNTLHAFEEYPFEEAVIRGERMFHRQPYLSEHQYRDELEHGRISLDHLRQILMRDLDESADILVAGFGTRYTLRLAMLQMPLHSVPAAELLWLKSETDMLSRFRHEVPAARRDQMVASTRKWVLEGINSPQGQNSGAASLPDQVTHAITEFGHGDPRYWGDKLWEEFCLRLLWNVCQAGAFGLPPGARPSPCGQRHRDLLLEHSGRDTDQLVHELLIPFCAAYVDQGLASWTMPHRERGFARCFIDLHGAPHWSDPDWLRAARGALRQHSDRPFNALNSIEQSLTSLGVIAEEREDYLTRTMLALGGWAGMLNQLETNAPWLPRPLAANSFLEFLAIRLILDCFAVGHVCEEIWGRSATINFERLKEMASDRRRQSKELAEVDQRTFTAFQLAQYGGWTPRQLVSMTSCQWAKLFEEIEAFTSEDRRRIFHLAYENRYKTSVLDAISIHVKRRRQSRLTQSDKRRPRFTAVFCIDDREESFRRHLEEIAPDGETASAAGFFAVAMYYQGADHAHYRPLCPNVITPIHYVREEPLFSAVDTNERRAEHRRRLGRVTHGVHTGSRTLIGGWLTTLFGAVATFPLVARIMAPRLTSQIRENVGTWIRPAATELIIERMADQPGPQPAEALGYSLSEMAAIVKRILEDIGKVTDFPQLILFFGHGSSSLNNPHESAYNCGACSGGRGGPNARAFARMANDPRVRLLLAEQGLHIPIDVHFVGGFHNTCNDKVEYYDLDLLPRTHRALFREIEASVDLARQRNAHERCRRFESAPLDLTPHAALEHVEQRSEDLSQARPEYNHATNALVIVGRREWSRGLFLDRRSFLTSYDPRIDDEPASILARILAAAIPVCAGISLEYYFSTVDSEGYGCGSKLPHNITSMLGVMTGAASDLRPGLSRQMIEIHEPMRILFVIETRPETMLGIMQRNEIIHRLVYNRWVRLAVIDGETAELQLFEDGKFVPYQPESHDLPEVDSSQEWYRNRREHLGCASIRETTIQNNPLKGVHSVSVQREVAQ